MARLFECSDGGSCLLAKEVKEEDGNIFQKLKQTSKLLDTSLVEFNQHLKTPVRYDCESRRAALATLNELQRQVTAVKDDCKKLKEQTESFDNFREFLNSTGKQLHDKETKLTKIEEFMKRYGFVPPEKDKENYEEKENSQEASTDLKEEQEEVEKQRASTPVLSDFGLSSYTLDYLTGKQDVYRSAVKSASKQQFQTSTVVKAEKYRPNLEYDYAREIHQFGETPLYKKLQYQMVDETPMIFRQSTPMPLNPMPTPLFLNSSDNRFGGFYTPLATKANKQLFMDGRIDKNNDTMSEFQRLDSPTVKFQDAEKPASVTPEEPVITSEKKSKSGKIFSKDEMPTSPQLYFKY